MSAAALSGVTGDRLSLDEYIADFQERFEAPDVADCWKIERQQTFVEQGSTSYDAFARGDWTASLELIRERRESLRKYHEDVAARGITIRRVRVVAKPISDYLLWELNSLRQRRELGELIRVVGPDRIADLENDRELPEILGLDERVVYQVLYDTDGAAEGAIRSTDVTQIQHWSGVFDRLHAEGEDMIEFFDRDVTGLRPSNAL